MSAETNFSMEGNNPETPKERSRAEIILEKVNPIIDNYRQVLREDADDLALRHLEELSKERLQEHERQLDEFSKIFSEYWQQPSDFKLTVQNHKNLTTRMGNRQTFSVRFSRSADEEDMLSGIGQTQLSFHVNIAGSETAVQALYALGVKGHDPHTVLQNFFRQSRDQIVTMNTVKVTPSGVSYKLAPQAGLTLRYLGEREARAGGVTYVGTQEHVHDLPDRVSLHFFSGLQKAIIRSAGFKPQKT